MGGKPVRKPVSWDCDNWTSIWENRLLYRYCRSCRTRDDDVRGQKQKEGEEEGSDRLPVFATMLFLESENKIIKDVLEGRLGARYVL
jgi:hypothetical protein